MHVPQRHSVESDRMTAQEPIQPSCRSRLSDLRLNEPALERDQLKWKQCCFTSGASIQKEGDAARSGGYGQIA